MVLDLFSVPLIVILDQVEVLVFAILASPRSTLSAQDKRLETLVFEQQSLVIAISLSDLDADPTRRLVQTDLVGPDHLSVISEHGQLHVLVLQLAILLRQLGFASLQIRVKVRSVSDFSHQVKFVHSSSLIEPTTPRLHLGIARSILDQCHGKNLTLDVVVEELVTLHHEMVRDRLILVQLVTALIDLFGR